jgi:hypothetical protein
VRSSLFRLCARPVRLATLATATGAAATLAFAFACGGSSPKPKSPDELPASDGGAPSDAAPEGSAGAVCAGADLDLVNVLVQSACEVPNLASDAKRPDMSTLLDVKVSVNPSQVGPGGHADVILTFTNKSKEPLPLNFLLDPTPRFSIEVYTSTNKRAEMPKTKPPRGKNDVTPEPTAPGTARVTIAPGGKASARLDFNAVRLKWAPELLKGTPPELGYPTSPAGPLPKGAYSLKVVTPLVGVFEGSDREVSTAMTKFVVQ